jgi:hypothetical protein
VVWHALHDMVSTAPSGSLNSDAVIEIMLGILGCMIAVLAMIGAALGFFGFQSIKDEAKKIAKVIAKEAAKETFRQEFKRLTEIDSTVALGEAKSESEPMPSAPSKGRKVTDAELHKGKKT